jgi:hypothetical protein
MVYLKMHTILTGYSRVGGAMVFNATLSLAVKCQAMENTYSKKKIGHPREIHYL